MAYIYIAVLLTAVATATGASVTAEQSSHIMRRDAQHMRSVELGSAGELQGDSSQQNIAEQPRATTGVTERPATWFCVVNIGSGEGATVQGSFYLLEQARSVLNASPGSATNRQMICEMNAAGVVTGTTATDPPRTLRGGKNQDAGPDGGFERYWDGDTDITTMNAKCLEDTTCAAGSLPPGAQEGLLRQN